MITVSTVSISAFSVALVSIDDKLFLAELSLDGQVSIFFSDKFSSTGKILDAVDFTGVEVKNFVWSVGLLLIGVVLDTADRLTGVASDALCCGDD